MVCERGTLEASTADPRTRTMHRTTRRDPMEMQIVCAENGDARRRYRAQLDDFIGAIRERRAPFVIAESALRALAIIEVASARRTRMAQPWMSRIGASA